MVCELFFFTNQRLNYSIKVSSGDFDSKFSSIIYLVTLCHVNSTSEIEWLICFSAGSAYDCKMPGVVSNEADCQKFWLCKENPEGSRILEVSLIYKDIK